MKELNNYEKEYTALFMGKTYVQKYRYSFVCRPESIKKEGQKLFGFSEDSGMVDTAGESIPVTIKINKSGDLHLLSEFMNFGKLPLVKNQLIYRIPESAEVMVSANEKILLRKNILVSQFGTIVSIPVKLLNQQ
jgi:hypothetical protein